MGSASKEKVFYNCTNLPIYEKVSCHEWSLEPPWFLDDFVWRWLLLGSEFLTSWLKLSSFRARAMARLSPPVLRPGQLVLVQRPGQLEDGQVLRLYGLSYHRVKKALWRTDMSTTCAPSWARARWLELWTRNRELVEKRGRGGRKASGSHLENGMVARKAHGTRGIIKGTESWDIWESMSYGAGLGKETTTGAGRMDAPSSESTWNREKMRRNGTGYSREVLRQIPKKFRKWSPS